MKKIINIGLFSLLPIKIFPKNYFNDCEITTSDIQGPFYIENSPNIYNLTPPEITSDFLFITGTIYANDCITPIPNAVVDVWHANKGVKDTNSNSFINSDYDEEYFRAKIYTDQYGNYAYQTILPGKYLNGSQYRPSHIHYKSSYMGQNEVTTQLYFEGDNSIPSDPWASNINSQNRIIPLINDNNGDLHGVFDITLETNPDDINLSKLKDHSLIKGIHPNPITNKSTIYLNRNNEECFIEICNINGKSINKITRTNKAIIPISELLNSSDIKKGLYIIKISSNNKGVEAKRIVVN